MRRPLCWVAALFALLIGLSVIVVPAGTPFYEEADGRIVILTGRVKWKEYKVRQAGQAPWEEASQGAGQPGEQEKILQVTLEDVSIESGIPPGAAQEIFDDDKVLCELGEDLEAQDSASAVGSIVRVRGRVSLFDQPTGDGQFDEVQYYHDILGYLFRLGDARILSYSAESDPLLNSLYRLRGHLSEAIDTIFPDAAYASVMKAILLGQSGLLDPDLKGMYQANGLIRIVSISGLHISILGVGLFNLLRKTRLPIPAAASVCAAWILAYGILTGMHLSCLRAIIMFMFYVAAPGIGRTYDMLTAMSAASILLLIEQPMYIAYSGFQYSFGALMGVGILAEYLPKKWKFISVALAVLPVQLWHYYTFPLYSIGLNLLVMPLMSAVMIAGIAALGIYMLPGGTAVSLLIGRIAQMILQLYELMCAAAEKLPFHTLIPGRPPVIAVALYLALLAAAAAVRALRDARRNGVIQGRRETEYVERTQISLKGRLFGYRTAAAQAVIIGAAVLILMCVRFRAPFSMYMLDVGQGDGLFVEAGRGRDHVRILVDGGSSDRSNVGKYTVKPFLKYHGAGYIDLAVLTHEDYDHCSGLIELLKESGNAGEITVGRLVLPDVEESGKGDRFREIEEIAASRGIPILYMSRGQMLRFGDLDLYCLHPAPDADYEDSNENSLTLLVRDRSFSALLTGDLEGQGEADFMQYFDSGGAAARRDGQEAPGKIDVLKVAHHGSKFATGEEFLKRFDPDVSLISCGANNRYGHPAPELLERLEDSGTRIYDTRMDGQITITMRGDQYRVRTKKRESR